MTAHPNRAGSALPATAAAAPSDAAAVATDPPPSLAVTVPAVVGRVREVRQAARHFAEQHGVERPDDVALAIGEACTNVVVHAYVDTDVGELRLTGSREGPCVLFMILDDGAGLIPRADSPGLGLGLPVIAQLADEFEISGGNGCGTRVRIGFAVAEPADADGSAQL